MKIIAYLVIGFAALMVLGALMRFAIGILFWVGLTAVVGAIAVAAIRGWMEDRSRVPSVRQERKLDREAERALKDIERKLNS